MKIKWVVYNPRSSQILNCGVILIRYEMHLLKKSVQSLQLNQRLVSFHPKEHYVLAGLYHYEVL